MSDEQRNPFTVLVCGGGNAAQVATSMFAARYHTIAVSLFADEAARWKTALGDDAGELQLDTGRVISSVPSDITNDPSVAAKADAIVLAVPSFAHGQYFTAFAPYLKPGTIIATMPARSGGDIVLAACLGEKAKDMVFVGFETLPWACRFTEWGKKATVLGTKESILAAVTPPSASTTALAVLQGMLGVYPNICESPNNLGISLRNPGAVIHPGVMYGRWCEEKWDGQAVSEKPLFYQGVDDFTEQVLLGLTGEVMAIRQKIEEMVPGLDLSDACDLKQWYLDCYGTQIEDTSTLMSCMNTNPAYKGLTHPCKEVDGAFMPDLNYRYLSEDVPTGMCFNKGLGELLGVPMPTTDKVLAWAQKCLGKSFLVDGKMTGADVAQTRAPQACGITDIQGFFAASKIDPGNLLAAVPRGPPPADEGEKENGMTVLICGGGNAAQVATSMFAARYNTIAISLFADEAAKWKDALSNDDFELTLDTDRTLKAKPDEITNDPSVAARANVIVLAVPSFAHGQYFEAFAPHLRPGTIIATMPARSGGDLVLAGKLGEKANDVIFVGFETLPWACRFTEWGRKATVLGTKGSILAAVTPPSKKQHALSVLQGLLGVFPHVKESPNNLGISLRNPGAVIHPGVMYGRWCEEKWDGAPVAAKPLFYQGVDDFTESVLLALTGEVQAIRHKIEALIPGLDLDDGCDLKKWYMDCYSGQMADTSSLKGCMNTNSAYEGLTHPCKEVEGGFTPDLNYRYLSEDVPTGMCFNKGLGEILGVPMPMTDKVLSWAQGHLGLSILVDGKMAGPDVAKTRAPQASGICTVDDFLKASKIEKPDDTNFTVLVCGGGNGAQVATAMFAARFRTIACSLYADEAQKWREALGDDEFELSCDTGRTLKAKPDLITNDPSCAKDAHCIVLAVPSFAHGQYFEAFAPYLKPGTIIATMPARSGGDLVLAGKLGAKAKQVTFVGFETLPWACRFTEWGKKASILSTKGSILAAVTPPVRAPQALRRLQGLLGVFPEITLSPNNLGVSLRNPGAVIHPGVMYGRWCPEKWDGNVVSQKPLFYQGVDDFTEEVLSGLTGEVQAIRKKFEQLFPKMDLQDACDLKQWYMDCYSGQMTDTSTLKACMNTNPGYAGLTHPCKEVEGGYMPDLNYRYLSEDVPTGMCFNAGLGEIVGVPMPTTHKVLAWAQGHLGLSILVDGKMQGPDVGKTRAPQAQGITTLEAFCAAAKIEG